MLGFEIESDNVNGFDLQNGKLLMTDNNLKFITGALSKLAITNFHVVSAEENNAHILTTIKFQVRTKQIFALSESKEDLDKNKISALKEAGFLLENATELEKQNSNFHYLMSQILIHRK